jgi:PilZ domain
MMKRNEPAVTEGSGTLSPGYLKRERRSEVRMPADKKVRVDLADGSSACLGTILDLSLSGARVKVDRPVGVGQKLVLVFHEQQQKVPCTVVRSSDHEIGVTFDLAETTVQ